MIKNRLFRLQSIQGESIQVGNATVTPFSRRLSLGLPEWLTANKGVAFVYQQPARIKIEQDGQVSEVPIRDYQTMIIASLLLLTTVFMIIAYYLGHKEKNQ